MRGSAFISDTGVRHLDEIRPGELDYAKRNLIKHASRNKTGMCHLDGTLACGMAWRCGFEYRVECCAAFAMKAGMANRCGGVATSCRMCARVDKEPCGWECSRKLVAQKGVVK
jgi:hypothetical protein